MPDLGEERARAPAAVDAELFHGRDEQRQIERALPIRQVRKDFLELLINEPHGSERSDWPLLIFDLRRKPSVAMRAAGGGEFEKMSRPASGRSCRRLGGDSY